MRILTRTATRQTGNRFRLLPQSPVLEAYREPETVWISCEPGTIGPGPSDDRMYVIDALDKRPYDYPFLPPYTGPARPPVTSDAGGHFDYLPVDDPGFRAAHMYGTVRRVQDIWESYFGQRISTTPMPTNGYGAGRRLRPPSKCASAEPSASPGTRTECPRREQPRHPPRLPVGNRGDLLRGGSEHRPIHTEDEV